MPDRFNLTASYTPAGDQPHAIKNLVQGLNAGQAAQTLLGVTGSGKTFTMAHVVGQINRPALFVCHNKTLAAQLYSELKQFFPKNAVEYFVSYYDYYQPEAYIAASNVYIEKDLAINETLEKLRMRTVSSLLSGRRDVVVVASVSCIYGLSNPETFQKQVLRVRVGSMMGRDDFLQSMIALGYDRSDQTPTPGSFRVRGDTVDVSLSHLDQVYRFVFLGDELESISSVDAASGSRLDLIQEVMLWPASLFVTSRDTIQRVTGEIQRDLEAQVSHFEGLGQQIEAQRIRERTELDLEMLRELGYCSGIENYARYFDQRKPGERPFCLLDYFPQDYLLVIDESHVTLPQIRAMWGGDQARKASLVENAFRLPAAFDNRPLNFQEFESLVGQVIYVSATPAAYELEHAQGAVVEQVVRPTGLLDPQVYVRPTAGQIDDLMEEVHQRIARQERVLITTLTKRMAEELSDYLKRVDVQCAYLHSDIKTLERVKILQALRLGKVDVLIGVNLLREGLDLPEVSLVIILDADKEGFLRNYKSLIQTMGRAARHPRGSVVMYADSLTQSMQTAIEETRRRRVLQEAHNRRHDITPSPPSRSQPSVELDHMLGFMAHSEGIASTQDVAAEAAPVYVSAEARRLQATQLRKRMEAAAAALHFVEAAQLRDELFALENHPTSVPKDYLPSNEAQ